MNKIQFDDKTLNEVSDSIEKKLSGFLNDPLTKVLEENKEGIKPLLDFYKAAKKGKGGITKKIAKDVSSKLFAKFARDFMPKGLSSLGVDVDKQGDDQSFSPNYSPYDRDISIVFKIKESPPPVEKKEKMKFNFSLSGGFYDLTISKAQNNKKQLKFGELGGALTISISKLPFIDENEFLEQTLLEKDISVGLSPFLAQIID